MRHVEFPDERSPRAASDNSSGDWNVCNDAIHARVAGNLNFDATGVSWESQPAIGPDPAVEVARGTFDAGAGENYRFECAVASDDTLVWLDATPQ